MSHFLETQKGLTATAGESDVMELMESDLQISNTNFYIRILLLFSHCPLYVCVLGGQRLSLCSRNGGPHAHILRYSVPLSLFEVSLWSCPCVLTGLGLLGEQTL